VIAVLFCCLHQ